MRRWYSDRPIWVLVPITALFCGLAWFRRWCYRHHVLRTVRLPVPVIVVGNITVGGTGKTPFVIWLTQRLQADGYRPGIITRGYGGKSRKWPLRATPGSDPLVVGDEAVLLARRTGLPVMVGLDRVRAARRLLDECSVNIIVSDDGLQHWRMDHDLGIVMVDAMRGFGNSWRLPAGPLRESTTRLEEVDLVIYKIGPAAVAKGPGGVLAMRMALRDVVPLGGGPCVPLAEFPGRQVHAVAAIGHPEAFFMALAARGWVVDGRPLPDHSRLSPMDLFFDDDLPVLITEKDAVKCQGFSLPHHWYVTAAAEFSPQDATHILHVVRQRLQDASVASVVTH